MMAFADPRNHPATRAAEGRKVTYIEELTTARREVQNTEGCE